jgi:hypothetical protein
MLAGVGYEIACPSSTLRIGRLSKRFIFYATLPKGTRLKKSQVFGLPPRRVCVALKAWGATPLKESRPEGPRYQASRNAPPGGRFLTYAVEADLKWFEVMPNWKNPLCLRPLAKVDRIWPSKTWICSIITSLSSRRAKSSELKNYVSLAPLEKAHQIKLLEA